MANDTLPTITTQQLLMELYQTTFPTVARYVSRKGGSFDQAKDVFQDAVIIYYEKAMPLHNAPLNQKAYLLGIAKHLWLKSYQEHNRYISLNELGGLADTAMPDEKQPLADKLLHYLEATGQKCLDLLKSFYYDKQSMLDIANSFGFSGERSATVQKFKCLEKVRTAVKNKGLIYEDFVE